MTPRLNIMADLRDQVAVIESIAAVNRFDADTAMRLFTGLARILDDVETMLEHGLAHNPALIRPAGPLAQRDFLARRHRGGLLIIDGDAA